jgi:chromosome segregation ATPase
MAKLAELFGRRDGEVAATPPDPVPVTPAAEEDAEAATAQRADPVDTSATNDTSATKIGEENEALRNLLVDAGMKVRQFDEYKIFFTKLIEPASQALRTLEQEKTSNIDLRRRLEQAVARGDGLHSRTHELETRHAILVSENEKLRQELDLSRLEARDAERSRAEFAGENLLRRSTIADLERQFSLETSRVNTLSDECQRLRDETVAAEEKASRIAAELSAARDKIDFLEGETTSLQKSLDQVSEQATQAARRFTENETALTAAKTRLLQLEASNSELSAERDKLRSNLDANSSRHGSEQSRIQMQIDAVRARAAAAEKLLTEARQLIARRGEEMRTADQRNAEAAYASEKAEKRIAELEAALSEQRAEVNEIKAGRDRLIEKSGVAVNALKLRETQLQRAEDAAKSMTERTARLETELREGGEVSQRRIDQLAAALDRERLDHQVTEGALDSARTERDQLQADVLRLQMEANRRAVNDDADDMVFPTRGANAA